MQLRTVKKPKIKDFDFGNNVGHEITSIRKNSHSKEVGEKEIQESSNEVTILFFKFRIRI